GLLLAAAAACGSGSGSGSGSQSSAPAAQPAGAATSAAAASSGDIGVPECDEYIKKYEACVSGKVPQQAQASLRQTFDVARSTGKQAAATPQARASLATSCKQALDMARQSMQAYGCSW